MTRRIDKDTAEKISLSLLTRAAFGYEAGLRNAVTYGIPVELVNRVLSRWPCEVRGSELGIELSADRRRNKRPSEDK